MSFESEVKDRFGGFWNSLVLLLVIIICLRFTSIELAEESMATRVHCALHLFLGCLAAGVVLGLMRIFLSFSNDTYTRAPASANFVKGVKFGVVAGGILILIVGVIQLENFLGPFQPILDAVFNNIYALFE